MRTLLFYIFPIFSFLFFNTSTTAQSCEGGTSYSWDDDIAVIFAPCSGCHGGTSGLFLNSYAGISAGGNQCATDNLLTGTTLIDIIQSGTTCSGGSVPAMNGFCGSCMDAGEISAIAAWIADGAPEVCAVLPVVYADISAEVIDHMVQLSWSTVTEINSERFDIYHSTDLASYDHLGTIQAAGHSTDSKDYEFEHDRPSLGYNYYRIVQTDFDGTENVSRIVSIRYTGDQKDNFIRLYPNPTAGESYLVMDTPLAESFNIRISDVFGKTIYDQFISDQSTRMFSLNTADLRPGSYYVMVYAQDELLYSSKLIKAD